MSVRSIAQGSRDCLFYDERPASSDPWPFPRYSLSACLWYCNAKTQAELCNCTHHFMPRVGKAYVLLDVNFTVTNHVTLVTTAEQSFSSMTSLTLLSCLSVWKWTRYTRGTRRRTSWQQLEMCAVSCTAVQRKNNHEKFMHAAVCVKSLCKSHVMEQCLP